MSVALAGFAACHPDVGSPHPFCYVECYAAPTIATTPIELGEYVIRAADGGSQLEVPSCRLLPSCRASGHNSRRRPGFRKGRRQRRSDTRNSNAVDALDKRAKDGGRTQENPTSRWILAGAPEYDLARVSCAREAPLGPRREES
jgi:hypothetical protein